MDDVMARVLERDPYSEKNGRLDPTRDLVNDNLTMRKVLACLVLRLGGKVEIDCRDLITMPAMTTLEIMTRPDLNGNVVVRVR